MANLSSTQASALAQIFLDVGKSVGDFLFQNWNEMTDEEREYVSSRQWEILKQGEDILAFSTVLVMDEVDHALSEIDNITADINSSIAHLQNIHKGINVAAAVVALGSAILSRSPEGIGESIWQLSQSWKS